MLLICLFLRTYAKTNYRELVDLTKESTKNYKVLSEEEKKDENNHIRMPGYYEEKDVSYILKSPIFATDSIIVKGYYIKDDLLGFIPTNNEEFETIRNFFDIVDRKTKTIYQTKNFIEKIDDVYIYSVKKVALTSEFDLKYVDLTLPPIEKEFPNISVKLRLEIKSDESTRSNIIYITASFCYNTEGKPKYSLLNIEQFDWPYIKSLGKWNNVLKHVQIGMVLNFEIKMTGFLDGVIEITTDFVGGVGFDIKLQKYVENLLDKQIFDLVTFPYIPMKSVSVLGIGLGLECGLKLSTFLEAIKITLPEIRILGGLHFHAKAAMNYDLGSIDDIISNFHIVEVDPRILKEAPTLSELIESISLTFTITPSLIPLYLKLDLASIKGEIEFRVDFPFTYIFKGNMDCTRLVEFSLDHKAKIVVAYDLKRLFCKPKKDEIPFDLYSNINLIKQCIYDYTNKYKESQIYNEYEHDTFNPNVPIDPDPDEPPKIPTQHFTFSTEEIADKEYTATFTEPYEDGQLDVSIPMGINEHIYIIFSLQNGYITPDKSIKLDGEDIYLVNTTSSYYNDGSFYLPINFKRYKQQSVVFHFYGVYSLYNNNGDLMCPKVFPVEELINLVDIGCIGTQSTQSMVQCCNDCDNKFCYDPVEKKKIGGKYYLFYFTSDFIFHSSGTPYWVPEYHTFPDNIESFEIPGDEYVYSPRVKCDRCDSVQFIVNGKMYPSKHWGKTKLFTPNIPTNGYYYDPDIEFSFDINLNTLEGFDNQNIKVIAICNSNDKSYCYSKCIEPKGYSIIEMKNKDGINIYSGNISKLVPENIYERNSLYQVVNYDEIPKNVYCSKSWNGNINVIQLPEKEKVTLSVVDSDNKTKIIKAYYGNTYVPFSKSNFFSNMEKFFQNLGININESNANLLEESYDAHDFLYATIKNDGSIEVIPDYFDENNIQIDQYTIKIPSSSVTSVEIIHEEFVANNNNDNKNKNKKIMIISICVAVGAVIIICAIVFTVIYIRKNKRVGSQSLP